MPNDDYIPNLRFEQTTQVAVQLRLFVVEMVGVVPLAETPRSNVINVVLCLQVTLICAP